MIPGNDDALRAIRLFTNKIADAVVEGRQLATEQDFAAEKIVGGDETRSRKFPTTSSTSITKYTEQLMSESMPDEDLPSMSLPRKGPAPSWSTKSDPNLVTAVKRTGGSASAVGDGAGPHGCRSRT